MIFSSLHYYSRILGFLHVKFIADFRTMVKACSGCQFGLCRQFSYRTIIPPTPCTLMHCIVDSADCATTVPPPASMPPHMLHLFVCLFVYLCHWCTCCLLC